MNELVIDGKILAEAIRDGKAKNEKPNDWINPAFYEYDN